MHTYFIRTMVLLGLSLFAFGAHGQEGMKPGVGGITVSPSEPVVPTGTCKSSTSGYLEKNGRSNLSDKVVGEFLVGYLRGGYIVTVYPATKRGVFVDLECTNATASVPR